MQFDKALDALEHKLPRSFEHLEAAREEILAFTAFPKSIWRQIWSKIPTPRRIPPTTKDHTITDTPRPRT